MAIAMVAMLAFGGTYAYFTSGPVATGSTTATLGTIKLKDNSATLVTENKLTANVLPTEKVFGEDGTTLSIVDMSNRESYIFVTISYSIKKSNNDAVSNLPDLTFTDGTFTAENKFISNETTVYYYETTAAATPETGTTYKIEGINIVIPYDWDNTFQGATITLSFEFKSIQKAGFSSAEDAYAQWLKDGGAVSAPAQN